MRNAACVASDFDVRDRTRYRTTLVQECACAGNWGHGVLERRQGGLTFPDQHLKALQQFQEVADAV